MSSQYFNACILNYMHLLVFLNQFFTIKCTHVSISIKYKKKMLNSRNIIIKSTTKIIRAMHNQYKI